MIFISSKQDDFLFDFNMPKSGKSFKCMFNSGNRLFSREVVLNRDQASIDEGDLEDFYNRIADFRICQSIVNNGTDKSLYREVHGRLFFYSNVENI